MNNELMNINQVDIWFQQDNHTLQFANDIIDLLRQTIPVRIITGNDDFNCPLRSCDFERLGYFFWHKV